MRHLGVRPTVLAVPSRASLAVGQWCPPFEKTAVLWTEYGYSSSLVSAISQLPGNCLYARSHIQPPTAICKSLQFSAVKNYYPSGLGVFEAYSPQ